MSVLVILELQIQPEEVEAYLRHLSSILPDSRAFAGCEGIIVHQNEDDPTDVVLLERWASKGDHEKYGAWRRDRGDLERLGQGLVGPPKMRYFYDVGI